MLKKSFFNRDTVQVAKDLIGCYFVRESKEGRMVGKIVETEAYKGIDDLACHASKGKTERTKPLFGEVGLLYVYLNYGIFWLTNIVAHQNDVGGVLIRSVQIVEGEEIAKKRVSDHKFVKLNDNLATGPGKFSVAFGINGDFHNLDITKSDTIYVEDRKEPILDSQIVSAKRIGVDYAEHCKDYLWRFYLKGNKYVSK